MSFELPLLLWALLLIPVLVVAYMAFVRRSANVASRFATEPMRPNVMPARPGWRRHATIAIYLVGITVLILAMARPLTTVEVPRERATVVLVMDASSSMNQEDIDPNRLVAAQRAAGSLLDQLPERFQVGVVAFWREARTVTLPTTDRVAVRGGIVSLTTKGGTSIGDGLAQGLKAAPRAEEGPPVPTVIVLLSDGRNNSGEIPPELAADRAARRNIRVHTVGLGSASSAQGANLGLLDGIAATTGGRFFNVPTADELEAVYRDIGSRVAKVRQRHEVTSTFLGAALLFLALGGGASALWFNRFP